MGNRNRRRAISDWNPYYYPNSEASFFCGTRCEGARAFGGVVLRDQPAGSLGGPAGKRARDPLRISLAARSETAPAGITLRTLRLFPKSILDPSGETVISKVSVSVGSGPSSSVSTAA